MKNEKPITKDTTKEKIILFVIGVLIGAVISTGAFFAYIKLADTGTTSNNHSMQIPGGTPPEMPSDNQGGTPPEMPSSDQSGTPPEMPNDNNSSNTNNQNGPSSSKSNKTNQSTTND